jgi:hypothetical protein
MPPGSYGKPIDVGKRERVYIPDNDQVVGWRAKART